jgi:hypothetical protein
LLSILNAWKKDGTSEETPWHITELGWHIYLNHTNPEIRQAARQNPYHGCPSEHLQRRRRDFKHNLKATA